MPEISFDPVDTLAAGAVGEPGQRAFYLQAAKDGQVLSVLVEKAQIAVLAERVARLLEQAGEQFPDLDEGPVTDAGLVGDPVPLFRAVAIGIGFDPSRQMIVFELHEQPVDDDDEDAPGGETATADPGEAEGYIVHLWCSPGQARAMAVAGTAAVSAGRPPCPMCGNPLDPTGHVCPKLNGHAKRPGA